MKKIILITLFLGIITCINAQDSLKFPYKNSFKISPFDFANKTLSVNYERGFGNSFGLMLNAGLYYYERDYTNIGYMGELQFRYYFDCRPYKENVWNRFFFAPYVFNRQYEITNYKVYVQELIYPYNYTTTLRNYTINSYGGGTVIGYSLAIKKVSLEVFLGGGIRLSDDNLDNDARNEFENDIFAPARKGILPKAGFNLGFFF